MFNNYFKTAFRNLWKNKGYTFLNIAGLAIGITCAALIFLWVENEVTWNHYFSNHDNLYKVKDRQTYDGQTFTFDATPGPLAQGMKTEIPGIKNTARTTWGNRVLFSLHDKSTYEQGMYVDSSFLSMFKLQFMAGNASQAFNDLYSVVISETMAKKFFGSTNAIGKTLQIDNDKSYIVSGVIKDLPENVSFRFDWLSPFQIYLNDNPWLQQLGSNGIVTYAETDRNVNVDNINKKLYNYIQTKDSSINARMSIYPMSRWRLYDSFDDGKEVPGRIKYVNLFSLIAWIILIIACINFMNLATARSQQRAREVGVRKVLGAGKAKLIAQFIGESLIMSLISALLAIALIYLALPAFNHLLNEQLSINLSYPSHIGALLAIAILCGLIAGSYPAFYLSSFNPVGVLKGIRIKSGSAGFIRKGLVIVQFAISVTFIICTVIIYQQINHIKERNLGYNKQDLIYLSLNGNMKQNFTAIRNDLQQSGAVENATLSKSSVLQLGSNTADFNWDGKDPNKQVLITIESVSPEYIATMGMKLKAGRDFYNGVNTDTGNIVINDAMAKLISKQNVVGKVIYWGDSKRNIIGVVNDFLYNDMYSSAAPLMLDIDTASTSFLTIRMNANADLQTALPKIENIIKKDNPGYPVEYKLVDDSFSQLFQTETLIGKLAGVFAVLAILISCLGLFGLAAYTAEQRKKEIGIRKVLGASVQGVAGLLSKDFLVLVGIACIVSFPVAWLVMNNWLQSYSYRIEISWLIFIVAGVLAILIALLTVSFQAIKAAIANPVKSLRTE